jgi:hypothetical protein
MLRVKVAAACAFWVVLALVFFPRWLGVTVAAGVGAFGVGVAVLGAAVVIDPAAGVVSLRLGLLFKRVRLADITAVIVDKAKLSLRYAGGWEFSFYAWRHGRIDALLRLPVAAGDIGHAISAAATAAQASGAGDAAQRINAGQTSESRRLRLGTAFVACVGALSVAGSLLVRVHWDNPALTVIGVILALALGVTGLFELLASLFLLLVSRWRQPSEQDNFGERTPPWVRRGPGDDSRPAPLKAGSAD